MTTGGNSNHAPLSVFDELTVGTPVPTAPLPDPAAPTGEAPAGAPVPAPATGGVPVAATPAVVKQATQELLRLGVLYGEAKPNLFQAVLANRGLVAAILEPLDFTLRVDEVRAMAILAVAPAVKTGPDGEPLDDDGWNHPLVRRQRLTLAQSLLVAILRRRYVEHEKTSSGTTPARVPVDELIPELGTYLGDEGSDSANESRVRRLLEQLREHGLVSAVDDDEQVTLRPLICHVADPTSLQLLLAHYTRQAGGDGTDGTGTSNSDDPDATGHSDDTEGAWS